MKNFKVIEYFHISTRVLHNDDKECFINFDIIIFSFSLAARFIFNDKDGKRSFFLLKVVTLLNFFYHGYTHIKFLKKEATKVSFDKILLSKYH